MVMKSQDFARNPHNNLSKQIDGNFLDSIKVIMIAWSCGRYVGYLCDGMGM